MKDWAKLSCQKLHTHANDTSVETDSHKRPAGILAKGTLLAPEGSGDAQRGWEGEGAQASRATPAAVVPRAV